MRIIFSLLALLIIFVVVYAQDLPIELEAHRKPTIITNGNCLIKNARILTVTKGVIENGDILIVRGKIIEIGQNITPPFEMTTIDATGMVVMPGIVDAHLHRGSNSTNEGTDAITAEVRIEDVLNSSLKNVWQALASGQTSGLILHGSANPVGGQSVVVKLKYGKPVHEMPVPDAPRMIKFALGENVTRRETRFPNTRMGVEAVYRRAFNEARKYMDEWTKYEQGTNGNGNSIPPRKDLRLETLADILRGDIWVHCHSYRADEMLMMARLSKEYGFKIGALTHGVEAYKIAPELAEMGVGVSLFVDNWAFKLEGYDNIPYNAAICTMAGVVTSINTDGTGGTTAINVDAAKVMRFGGMTEDQALAMITINPAKQLGIDHRVGSIEVGKDADLVIWDGHPLSVYAKPQITLIEGEVYFQRRDAHKVDNINQKKLKLDAFEYKPSPPTIRQGSKYAITNATVHTVSGPVIENGTIIISDGRITAVGVEIPVPADAIVFDGKGKHVFPGFIDAGTQIGLLEFGQVPVASDTTEAGELNPDIHALTAVQVESAMIETTRFNGITTVLTRPRGSGLVLGQSALMNLHGWTREIMQVKAPVALQVNFPSSFTPPFRGDETCAGCDHEGEIHDEYLSHQEQELDPQSEQTRQLTGRLRNLTEFFEKAKDYHQKRIESANEPVDVKLEAMRPYISGRELVILEVRNAESIRSAIEFAKRFNLKAALAGAGDAWKEAELIAKSNISVLLTPAGRSTLGGNSPISGHDPYDTPYVIPYYLQKAGVKFAFQSEDGPGAMNLPFRVGMSCAYGLSREDALRALTLSAAEIFGVEKDLGSIETGKIANLFITDGDPFELTTNSIAVFINGQPIKLESRHTRLRDKYLQRLSK